MVGIEDADLDAGMRRERGDLLVAREIVGVVEQHADAHAPIGGAKNCIHQQLAGDVVLDDEVLQIDALPRRFDELRPRNQAVAAVGKQAKSGQARVRSRKREDLLAERGRFRMIVGGGALLRVVGPRQRRASSDDEREEADQPARVEKSPSAQGGPRAKNQHVTVVCLRRFHSRDAGAAREALLR
jgi:hypothetical protein